MGEFLICRDFTKTRTSIFNVTFNDKSVYIGKDGAMKLKNTKTKIPQSIPSKKVRDNFIFAYCTTCRSAQGSSIDGDVAKFHSNHFEIRNYRDLFI